MYYYQYVAEESLFCIAISSDIIFHRHNSMILVAEYRAAAGAPGTAAAVNI